MQIAYAELIAAGVITAAYFVLIPAYGMHGAAWATVIGFVIRFYWTNRIATQLYDMRLPWLKVILTALLALAFYLLSFTLPHSLLLSIFLRTILVILFIAVYFSLPILSRDEKN
jgi:O-antigen/teichoic acid export membrane protein